MIIFEGENSNILRIQWGMSGAFLTIFTNQKDYNEVLIGKRIEIPHDFNFSNLVVDENKKQKLTIKGTWYIYTRKALRDNKNRKIIGYELNLIRNNKNLCFFGNGETILLSQLAKDFGVSGLFDSTGASVDGYDDIYVTMYKNVRNYRTVVNAATAAAEVGFLPIFWPDGSVTYEKITNRAISAPMLQEVILNSIMLPIVKTIHPGAGRFSKILNTISLPPFIIEHKLTPGTIIEIPAGLIYELDEKAEEKEYYFVRDIVITLYRNTPRYWPRVSKITMTEIETGNIEEVFDKVVNKTKNSFEAFFKNRSMEDEENTES